MSVANQAAMLAPMMEANAQSSSRKHEASQLILLRAVYSEPHGSARIETGRADSGRMVHYCMHPIVEGKPFKGLDDTIPA